MNRVLIETRDVRRSFGNGRVHALRGVTFNIREREFVSIMGPSGSGKSSLLHVIGGMDREFTGEVRFEGADLRDLRDPARFRATVIGFVFQSPYLVPTLTVIENVQVPMFELSWPAAQRRERAEELLASLGLEERLRHLPSQLSGGERQRVAIARALANKPRLLLADEPTGNLDSASARNLMDILRAIHAEHGLTFLVVTHDSIVAGAADRTLRMLDGRIARDT